MNRAPSRQSNSNVQREHDPKALVRIVVILISGVCLAIGFVFAAQQHFAAVRLGYQSEELRREQQRLIEEQRRLTLVREQASAPERLQAAARELGLQPLQAAQIEVVTRKGNTPEFRNALAQKSPQKASTKRL